MTPGSLWLTVVQPTRGRRRPRWLTPSGPAARTASRSWRPLWRKPAASRPEARGERETGGPRARTDEPLPRERLARRRAGAQAHELPAHTLRDPETAPDPASEGSDREIGVALGERAQRAAQVRVGQEQRPRRRGTLAGGQRLPLPQPLDPEHERPGRLRALGRPVAGAPVDDDHLGVGEVAAQGGHGLADALLLVPRRDEDRQALGRATHPRS